DEGGFQIVERGAVNLSAEGDNIVNALGETLAGAADRLLHAVEEARLFFFLLFLVEGAEESLNHEFIIRGGSRRGRPFESPARRLMGISFARIPLACPVSVSGVARLDLWFLPQAFVGGSRLR